MGRSVASSRAYKDRGERRLAAEIGRIMLGAAVRAQREAPGDMEGCSSARMRWCSSPPRLRPSAVAGSTTWNSSRGT
ncbi:MAG: hypothetical protein ACLTSX_09565 [Collinsella sp.]